MEPTFLTGIIGSLFLVVGVALPDRQGAAKPWLVTKNWLFVTGGVLMLGYAFLNHLDGGSVFFVILEILIVVACVLMMLEIDDSLKAKIILACGLGLVAWSLFLFDDLHILFFIVGLVGIALGYAFRHATQRRDWAFAGGGLLVAMFSYLERDWIFFGTNLLFALFSGWQLYKKLKQRKLRT